MTRSKFEHGSREISEFYGTMVERHEIYKRRSLCMRPPWTNNPIFRDYKFCNVFRQLDRGTETLGKMMIYRIDHLRLWNIVWYRLFNFHENHAWFDRPKELRAHMTRRWANGETLFTDAHMTCSRDGMPKFEVMLDTAETVWEMQHEGLQVCRDTQSMEEVFKWMKKFYAIGPFIAYEMVCDFRFLLECFKPTDTLTWANVGPGAKRGMQRLGLEPTFDTMRELLDNAPELECPWPFELREIEHWLCEFDKYCRIEEGATHMRRFRS